jgi:hypothetical protein
VPGTIIEFEGYEKSYGHHVAAWCPLVENDIAYLLFIGRDKRTHTLFPYTHHHYPTIILALPSNFSCLNPPPALRPPTRTPFQVLKSVLFPSSLV